MAPSFMMGAFISVLLLQQVASATGRIFLAPLIVGILGIVVEASCCAGIYGLDPIYGLLLPSAWCW